MNRFQSGLYAKAAAAAAKRKVTDDAKALHKAQSIGLSEVGAYEGETIQAGGLLRTSTRLLNLLLFLRASV